MASDRSSEADEPPLVHDKQAIARIEAENTLRQFDAAMQELEKWLSTPDYRLKPSTILKLNRVALDRLSKYAGVFRPSGITIRGSYHEPVPADEVPSLVEEFCDYISSNWESKSPVHLAAYALWRLNWIHPFVDGNGRTARTISYLLLCARLGYRLPGTKTIPEQISSNKQPYYRALEAADLASKSGSIDVTDIESLIDGHLAAQLIIVHREATGNLTDRQAVADLPFGSRVRNSLSSRLTGPKWVKRALRIVEAHPAISGAVALLLATALLILFGR